MEISLCCSRRFEDLFHQRGVELFLIPFFPFSVSPPLPAVSLRRRRRGEGLRLSLCCTVLLSLCSSLPSFSPLPAQLCLLVFPPSLGVFPALARRLPLQASVRLCTTSPADPTVFLAPCAGKALSRGDVWRGSKGRRRTVRLRCFEESERAASRVLA